MKKHLLGFLLVFCVLVSVHAQLRSYVGIVRAMPNQKAADFYTSFAQDLTNRGLRTYAAAVNSYMKAEFFGSGFVYVAEDGKNYLITNNHVVENALELSVEFQHENGKIEKYEGLTVFAVSVGLDLAILAFPVSKPQPFTQSLPFIQTPITDGQAIWSAGFPGLGGNPLWQFGNGVITNAAARIPDLVDPALSTLIQHSAQIDSGNSGGPLLVDDPTSPVKYSVAGINTWKARGRQAANFAIPAKAVQQFIAEVFANSTHSDKTLEVQKAADQFIAAASDSKNAYVNTAKFISYEYVYSSGIGAFRKFLEKAPTNVRQDIISVFLNNSPLEAIRYILSFQILQQINPEARATLKTAAPTQTTGGQFEVSVTYAEKKPPTVSEWVFEQGIWRISSFADITPQDKKGGKTSEAGFKSASKLQFSLPFQFFLNASYNLEVPVTQKSHGFAISFMYYSKKGYLGYGFAYEMDSVYMIQTNDSSFQGQISKITSVSRNSLGALIGLRVPLNFGIINLMPYVNAGIGMGFVTETLIPYFSLNPGFYIGPGLNFPMNIMLGVSYKWKKDIFSSSPTFLTGTKNMISFSAIITF